MRHGIFAAVICIGLLTASGGALGATNVREPYLLNDLVGREAAGHNVGVVVFEDHQIPDDTHGASISVVDDVQGARSVGATICVDQDGDDIAEKCTVGCNGGGAVMFHQAKKIAVWVHGPVSEAVECDGGAGGVSGGYLGSAGGVFATFP